MSEQSLRCLACPFVPDVLGWDPVVGLSTEGKFVVCILRAVSRSSPGAIRNVVAGELEPSKSQRSSQLAPKAPAMWKMEAGP